MDFTFVRGRNLDNDDIYNTTPYNLGTNRVRLRALRANTVGTMAPRDAHKDGANGGDDVKPEMGYATLDTLRYVRPGMRIGSTRTR